MRLALRSNGPDFAVYDLVDREDGFPRGVAYVGYAPQQRGEVIATERCPPFELEWRSDGHSIEAILYGISARGERTRALHIVLEASVSEAEQRRVFEMITAGTRRKCMARPPHAQ